MHKVIIVDDHQLVAKGIAALVDTLPDFEVSRILKNGKELLSFLKIKANLPDLILLDLNMPVLDGFGTMQQLNEAKIEVPVLALTINNDDQSVIRMLRLGVRGYLLKDTDDDELSTAMKKVLETGYYHNDFSNSKLLASLQGNATQPQIVLKEREQEFLNLACTDATYKEIAEKMFLSPKTVDHYRDALFQKFEVKSRIGMVMFALRNNLLDL